VWSCKFIQISINNCDIDKKCAIASCTTCVKHMCWFKINFIMFSFPAHWHTWPGSTQGYKGPTRLWPRCFLNQPDDIFWPNRIKLKNLAFLRKIISWPGKADPTQASKTLPNSGQSISFGTCYGHSGFPEYDKFNKFLVCL